MIRPVYIGILAARSLNANGLGSTSAPLADAKVTAGHKPRARNELVVHKRRPDGLAVHLPAVLQQCFETAACVAVWQLEEDFLELGFGEPNGPLEEPLSDLQRIIEDDIAAHGRLDCVLVDEAQFLGKPQVWQLSEVVDALRIPVLCYGLRTDFRGELFEGSQYLLAWADELQEIKTICHSGKKATMNVRVDAAGRALQDGPQVEIGGNDRYVSVSRAEFKKVMRGEGSIEPLQAPLPL